MASEFILNPETIVIAPQGTGSFSNLSISKTPFLGLMISKLSNNNSLNAIILQSSNYQNEWPDHGYRTGPTGSVQEYLWCNEPLYSAAGGTTAAGGGTSVGISGSLFSSSLGAVPFTTGSFSGSVMFNIPGLTVDGTNTKAIPPIGARYIRITLRSDSGGTFRLAAIGKTGG